jgi:hypothetical protein
MTPSKEAEDERESADSVAVRGSVLERGSALPLYRGVRQGGRLQSAASYGGCRCKLRTGPGGPAKAFTS